MKTSIEGCSRYFFFFSSEITELPELILTRFNSLPKSLSSASGVWVGIHVSTHPSVCIFTVCYRWGKTWRAFLTAQCWWWPWCVWDITGVNTLNLLKIKKTWVLFSCLCFSCWRFITTDYCKYTHTTTWSGSSHSWNQWYEVKVNEDSEASLQML